MDLHSGIEADIRVADAEPGHETRNSRHLGEPVEHLAGAGMDAHEGQERERCRGRDRGYGQSVAKRHLEYRGCISGNREAVYAPCQVSGTHAMS